MRRTPLLAAVSLVFAGALHAHPVPKDNHDRTVSVHLTPSSVVVEYRLEIDPARALRDVSRDALVGVGSREQFHAAFREHLAPLLADGLVAALDGEELTFRCAEQSSALLDHIRCDYRFVADWKPPTDRPGKFTFREANYPLDSESRLAVRLSHAAKLTLDAVAAPDAELIDRPADRRRPGDDERLRRLSAGVTAVASSGDVLPALPADFDGGRPGTEGLSRHASSGKPGAIDAGSVKPTQEEPEKASWWGAVRAGELTGLFDSGLGWGVMLALAAVFGAAHALTPGHGKTLVAAYLVGQHGTPWHALVLGLVVTLTHTGSVIVLATLLAWTDLGSKAAMVALNLVGGLLIAGLGAWLLMQRLRGGADHVHLGGGHDVPDLNRPGASWWSTVTLGMAGGIVPCWDAIVLLLFALSVQRLWMGVALLLAFSAGLAAVLIALGLAVVAAKAGAGRVAKGEWVERVGRVLPVLSAAAILSIGLAMTFGSVRPG